MTTPPPRRPSVSFHADEPMRKTSSSAAGGSSRGANTNNNNGAASSYVVAVAPHLHGHAHPLSAMLGARRGSAASSASRSRAGTNDSAVAPPQRVPPPPQFQQPQIPFVQTDADGSLQDQEEIAIVNDKTSWMTLISRWRKRKLRMRRVLFWLCAVGVFLFCFALAFVLPHELQRLAPVVIGSLLSFISALVILVSYLFQPQNRRYPNELLVYVALCEFGLALLALIHVMLYCSGSNGTSPSFCQPMSMRACSVMSALEMFLLLASVGWFGAAILHLFVSVSNPFANYKSQLKMYHSVVWSGSILISVAVPLIVFSKHFQDSYDMSSVEICRAVGLVLPILPSFSSVQEQQMRIDQWKSINMVYWGTLFALVVLLVVAAQGILVIGWWRSNSGTVIALKARRRMVKRMTIYVHTLNATWLVILVAFFVYRSSSNALEGLQPADQAFRNDPTTITVDDGVNLLNAIFHFLLAAKGYFTCVVWISVNKRCCAFRALLCGGSVAHDIAASTDGEDDSDEEMSNNNNSPLTWSASGLVSLEGSGGNGALAMPSGRQPLIPDSRATLLRSNNNNNTMGGSVPPRNPSMASSSSSLSSWVSQNNETLQREIIYYTVCGITKSILKSLQMPDTDIFFQQLLVGAERDSAFSNNSIISHVQNIDMLNSPRPYCQPYYSSPTRRMPGDSCNSTECATTATPGDSFSQRTSFLSSSSQQQQGLRGGSFNNYQHAPGRFSLYPVSQVPFELFDQEIELQSNRSSSLGLSPLFAGIRRTATTAFGQPAGASAAGEIEDPKPKVFIDYAPSEFRAIRSAFGLSDEMYLASFRTTAKERISAGSSGAFMFFSGDNSLIVKSMREKECRKLVKMIPAYSEYIQRTPKSRIIRFFGCHRIRLYGRNFYFVVMSNVLHSVKHTATITEKYDVKGSWIDRRARLPQVGDTVTCSECNANYEFGREDASTSFPFHMHHPDTILKDLDMKRKLHLPPAVAESLHAQLVSDSEFLNSMGIMDYSLLVGIHKCRLQDPWHQHQHQHVTDIASTAIREDSDDNWKSSSGLNLTPLGQVAPGSNDAAVAPEEVYFVGIIDILQEWDWEKQMEKVGKMLIGKSGSGISAIPPDAYCQRFKARVAQILLRDTDGELAAKPDPQWGNFTFSNDTLLAVLAENAVSGAGDRQVQEQDQVHLQQHQSFEDDGDEEKFELEAAMMA